MHKNFSEPELVELGCMIGLTLGQQSWLRLLNIEHHQVMAGTDASMAPGYEDMDKLKMTKAQADYWAKQKADEPRWRDRPRAAQRYEIQTRGTTHDNSQRPRDARHDASITIEREEQR